MPPTTAEVTADGLKTVVAAGVTEAAKADKAARQAKKAEKKEAARAAEKQKAEMEKAAFRALKASGLNLPDPKTRPGGSTGAQVNLNKPQTIRLSQMIRAIGANSWSDFPLERDFSQACQGMYLGDDHEQGIAPALPTSRGGFSRLVAEANINVGQGSSKAFRSWAARMAESEDAVTAAAQTGDQRLIMAARDAAEGTIGAGGALVPPEYLQQMFTLSIQTATAFANLPGISRIPVKSNMIILPRESVMPASAAAAEAAIVPETDATFGQQTILIKKQIGFNRYSNEMLADASPEYEGFLTKSLTRSVALRQDFEFLEGDGTGNHVLGLRYYPGQTAGTGIPAGADEGWAWGTSATAAVIAVGLGAGVEGPMRMLADARGHGWEPNAYVMHPDVMNRALALCKDANGRFLLESIGGVFGAPVPVPNIGALPTQITYVSPPWKAMLLGCPVFMSAQIPLTETYGESADTTHVFAGDWNFALLLERQAIEMARSEQIAFTTDQTAVRVSTRSAIALLAPAAFMCQLGVRATTLDTNE